MTTDDEIRERDRPVHNQRGFTLIELMVTVLVLAIVLTIGVPSFRQFIVNSRVTTQANLLVTSLNIARSEAINRSENVIVAATSGTNWHLGWTITTAGGTTLRTQGAFEGNSTLVGTATSLTYASTGFLSTGAGESFDLCNSEATTERQITVVAGGRVNQDSSYVCP
ncbi:GspH/FimT family pseudopilin [Sedimenticola sp.]|uniref:GspH/FimT family pseudopilin n=1 Tax=Sedimenticola sp. TaxID=1940285 RepID=UPI003D09B18D